MNAGVITVYIDRPNYLEKLIRYKDKDIVKIITGIRRCGKSVLLNELYYNYLLKNGVGADHIIKLSFDMQKWQDLRDPEKLYHYIENQIADESRYYIFLDEIQMVDGFEEVVNGIKAEFNSDVYITGSNSKLLSGDINTIFRGRGIEIKVFPLSFSEFYCVKGNTDKAAAFNEYIMYGGLPYAVLETEAADKAAYLKMICDTVVSRDIIDRYNIKDEALFSAVTDHLCSSIGSYVSASKIANTLKSNGYKSVDNETVSRYLSYMCDAFFVLQG